MTRSTNIYECDEEVQKLFKKYNREFFQGKIKNVNVTWSNRLTSCAGVTEYFGKREDISIRLSSPLLTLCPRRDLANTLLHEMIHAYLFLVDGNKEREEHGPRFHAIMSRINLRSAHRITVFHSYEDEVEQLQTHWWKCSGKCTKLAPKFGVVKRTMDRAPGPSELWWLEHNKACKGDFVKIKNPSKPSIVVGNKENKNAVSKRSGKERTSSVSSNCASQGVRRRLNSI